MCLHRQLKTLPLHCLTFPSGGMARRFVCALPVQLCLDSDFPWSALGFFFTVHIYLFLIATLNE